jgi:hypothetical protein
MLEDYREMHVDVRDFCPGHFEVLSQEEFEELDKIELLLRLCHNRVCI